MTTSVLDVDAWPTDVAEFRREFRDWLAEHLQPEWRQPPFPQVFPPGDEDPDRVAASKAWHEALHRAGWVAPGWPVEHGGRGLDLARLLVVAEEQAVACAPVVIGFQGIDLLGPTLIEHASPEQQARFLPPILRGEDVWCQGYSEPDAGSDLASLRTVARRDGDRYIVNGQKVWTSFGSRATWCFLLARTGPVEARHRSLSFFVVEMSTPGVTWRPIVDVTGARDFGELFLEDVEIPIEQRIGAEGDGWRVAMSSLGHERLLATNVAQVRVRFEELLRLVREHPRGRAHLLPAIRLRERLLGLEGIQARALELSLQNDPSATGWASLAKVGTTELRREIAEVATAILGVGAMAHLSYGMPVDPEDLAAVWSRELLASRAGTIYAGSSEIQRNILAERLLGLPR